MHKEKENKSKKRPGKGREKAQIKKMAKFAYPKTHNLKVGCLLTSVCRLQQ